jgi:hypothetical protein
MVLLRVAVAFSVAFSSVLLAGSGSSVRAQDVDFMSEVAQAAETETTGEGYVDEHYHWRRELDKVLTEDLCKNGKEYGQCDESRFPECRDDQKLCMNRQPRKDLRALPVPCADGKRCKDPYYYINYNEVACVPIWNEKEGRKFNCNKCDPGKYCPTFNRCVKRKKRFCPDWCGPGRRWCESEQKCLRFKNLGKNRKRESCSDPEWNESTVLTAFKKNQKRVSAAYNLDPET